MTSKNSLANITNRWLIFVQVHHDLQYCFQFLYNIFPVLANYSWVQKNNYVHDRWFGHDLFNNLQNNSSTFLFKTPSHRLGYFLSLDKLLHNQHLFAGNWLLITFTLNLLRKHLWLYHQPQECFWHWYQVILWTRKHKLACLIFHTEWLQYLTNHDEVNSLKAVFIVSYDLFLGNLISSRQHY